LCVLHQAWRPQTTFRASKRGDGIKSLRNTVLEVRAHLSKCWRGTWPEKFWNPQLSQTYVFYSTLLWACAHHYLFSENVNFSPVQSFCCWACDRASTYDKYKW